MLWRAAERRTGNPRMVLLRRFLFLLVLGGLHQLLQPGEALLPYALGGLLILLPTTFIPERMKAWVSLVFGVVATLVGGYSGGLLLIPGLFLVGFGLALLDAPQRFEQCRKPALYLLFGGLAVAIPGILLQLQHLDTAGFSPVSAYAGLEQAAVYIGLAGLAMQSSSLRRGLIWFFAPLGRTALTCYVSASAVGVLVALPFFAPLAEFSKREMVKFTDGEMFGVWGACVLFLVLQSLVARWWLARFGQGPLEKLWRRVTWGNPSRSH